MNTYAYARVSSYDQNLARQLQRLQDFGINAKHIFFDKKSGKDFERTNYRRLIKRLRQGDLLVITSIDRLGRNYSEIIEEWAKITKSIKADILVLDMPLLDTRSKEDTLLGKFISDIVLQILSFVAVKRALCTWLHAGSLCSDILFGCRQNSRPKKLQIYAHFAIISLGKRSGRTAERSNGIVTSCTHLSCIHQPRAARLSLRLGMARHPP